MAKGDLVIGGVAVPRGGRATIDLVLPALYTHAALNMPVQVVRGKRPGSTLFVTGVLHGEEINGVEVIRRLLRHSALKRLRGSLIAVPVVNVYGFIQHSRYLPDRRDLNRSFPGSESGSMASRVAAILMQEVVANANHGIDIHTGAGPRINLPQVRACLEDPETERLARIFGAPVIIDSDVRDGSLRSAVRDQGLPMLLYEGGEALRFDETSIRIGVRGILNVMRALGMLPDEVRRDPKHTPHVATASTWVRAPMSGVMRAPLPLGVRVHKGQVLAMVSDPFGEREQPVVASVDGIVIGRVQVPLVYEGEALFHVARFDRPTQAAAVVEAVQAEAMNEVSGGFEPPSDTA